MLEVIDETVVGRQGAILLDWCPSRGLAHTVMTSLTCAGECSRTELFTGLAYVNMKDKYQMVKRRKLNLNSEIGLTGDYVDQTYLERSHCRK